MELGTTIKNARKRAGLTQQELANKVGCALPYIGRIETNKRKPSLAMLEKIFDTLSLSFDDLTVRAETAKELKTIFMRLDQKETDRALQILKLVFLG